MSSNILKPGKYNKITKKNKDKKDNIIKKQIKKNKIYRDKNNNILLKFFLSAFAIVCIILLITYIPKIDTKKIIAVFTKEDNVKEKLIAGYNFKIGINNLDENKNIVVRELNKFANRRLINISDNYDIIYDFADEIKKIDNKTYEIYLKDNIDLSEKIKKINNVLDVKYNKKVLTISLKNDDPYFVYSLDFDLGMDNLYKYSDLKYTSNINNYLKEINLKNYVDSDEMVKDFREDNLDMFLTSKESDLRLIGKHEYSQKKYRDGEMYTLFINKDSEFLKNIDVRKGISYGINRNRIIKETLPLFSELI
ncbi:MAG: ABC transporter substrate-binding protein, partial [Clostridia bacterium]